MTKSATSAPEQRFERLLLALERELVETSDEEIVEAARDLGMNLAMKGSAAFIGLKFPSRWAIRDFFASEAFKEALRQRLRGSAAKPSLPPSAEPGGSRRNEGDDE